MDIASRLITDKRIPDKHILKPYEPFNQGQQRKECVFNTIMSMIAKDLRGRDFEFRPVEFHNLVNKVIPIGGVRLSPQLIKKYKIQIP